ncbi:MAG: cell division protein FtsL [Magnetococcales bacterium]|nr:cell division protein FtsL [Magnetococcales bacterium]
MNGHWLLPTVLAIVLAASAAATITSRLWMQESHRELKKAEKKLQELNDKELELRLEWVARTDLNTMERRAKTELGMDRPRYDQWSIVPP